MNITNKDIPDKFIKLNKFLNNVYIIWGNVLKGIADPLYLFKFFQCLA